jgi:hypothetical protein
VTYRLRLAALMSQVLVMGRSQRGFDGEIGAIGVDDDGDGQIDLADIGGVKGIPGHIPRWDPSPNVNGFGRFGFDDNGTGGIDDPGERKSPGSDDGPYASVGEIANAILHPLVADAVRKLDADELDEALKPSGLLDETDLFIMMGQIMNLITVQSNEFTVISRGRVIDSANVEVLAEQKLEEELAAR